MHLTITTAFVLGCWCGMAVVGLVVWWFEFRGPPDE